MENRKRIALIGILGAITLVVMLYGYNYLQNTPMFSPSKIFYAEFRRLGPLKINAYVYFNGLEVGRVKDIYLKKGTSNRIMVTFSVRNDIPLPKDVVAESYVPNPMYEANLYLRYTPLDRAYQKSDYLKEGSVIPGKVGSYLKDLQQAINPFVIAADSVIMELFPNKDSIQQLFKDAEDAIHNLSVNSKSYRKITYENKTPIIEFMLDFRDLSKKIDAQEDSINIMIANLARQSEDWVGTDFKKMIPDLSADKIPLPDLEAIDKKIVEYQQKIEAIASGQDSSYAWLIHDPAVVDSLRLQLDDLLTTVRAVRKNPEQFISIRKKKN